MFIYCIFDTFPWVLGIKCGVIECLNLVFPHRLHCVVCWQPIGLPSSGILLLNLCFTFLGL